MKIGIVTTWFERGAAYVSKQYMTTFLNQGHTVQIYARGGEDFAKDDPNWDNDNVYWQKSNTFPIYNYVELVEFKKWVDKHNFDFVLFNEQVWFEPVIYCKEIGLKVGSYIDYYTEPMISCFDIYDFVVCNTKKHLKAFENHKNPIYVPWGTDVSLFDASESRLVSGNVRYFHSCGMNPHRKGTDLLIKAYLSFSLSELEKTQLIIHTQLSIEKLIENLSENEVKKFKEKINKNIEIIDQTIPAPGAYHLGDIYVYPSRLDGLGLTVCEAASCGMPIIVPDVGPMNEFVHTRYDSVVKVDKLYSRYDGYYWPQNEVDLEDLKYKMLKIKEDFIASPSVTMDTRKSAVTRFNWDVNSSSLCNDIKCVAVQSVNVNVNVVNKCIAFNEKKFPYIYKLKYVYKLAFIIYNILKR